MTSRLRLLPGADVARLGAHCYLFDRNAVQENVIHIPTQRVSSRMGDVVRRLREAWPLHDPQPYAALEALFDDPAERATLAQLARAGYLETVPDLAQLRRATESGTPDTPQAAPAAVPSDLSYFRDNVLKHFFKRPAFFHLPPQIEDEDCDVALIGVPVSSTGVSSGTVAAPAKLRRDSQRAGFWFDIHAHGVYTETGCDGDTPRLLGIGTHLKDFGDVGAQARTIADLFGEISALIEGRLLPHGIRPLFIGGDHAVSFPILDCYLRHYPDLVLVHLDAHNDLFYTERVEFNHAGPVHALLAYSDLSRVLSFGLRTHGDPRVGTFTRLRDAGVLDARVRLHSLGALQRWLARPDAFRDYLRREAGDGRPCYLTIDLDVLSADAVAGQLSTPAGPGLGWQQLLEFITHAFATLNVVAADVVELNPDHKDRPVVDERETIVLLLELIDGLGRQRRAASAAVETHAQSTAPASPPRGSTASPRGFNRPCEIDRREIATLGYRDFLLEYALPGRPVVLTGFADEWPALSRWSIEYFLSVLAVDEPVEVAQFARAGDFGSIRRGWQSARETLARMAQRWHTEPPPGTPREYLVNWQFADSCAALMGDYKVPTFFAATLNRFVVPPPDTLRWLFIGEAGTGSATHTDVWNSSAWLMLISGRKRWRLVPATDAAACGRIGAWVDLFDPDHARYPGLASATLYETEQLPGEMLWAPPQSVHAVLNTAHSIAVTQNYVDLSNLVPVYDALLRGPATAPLQAPDGALLSRLVRRGLDDLSARGLRDAAEPMIAAVHDALQARRRACTVQGHGLDAALRELGRAREG